jgi:hypothetical protein
MDKYTLTVKKMQLLIAEHFHDALCRPVGSSYIMQRVNNDVDMIISYPDFGCKDEFEVTQDLGWEFNGSRMDDGTEFVSFKTDIDGVTANFIFVLKFDEYQMFGYAADVCRILHEAGVALEKSIRCDVHSLLRQRMDWKDFQFYKTLQPEGNKIEVVHKRPALFASKHCTIYESGTGYFARFARYVVGKLNQLLRRTCRYPVSPG